jgi:Fe-S oxidoreductase
MNPIVMTLMLLAAVGLFAWQAARRWRLMTLGPNESRFDQIGERLRRTWQFAFAQQRMRRYWWAGLAHLAIFFGFLVLLINSLILFGRGYSPAFTFWGLFADDFWLGTAYSFVKDLFIILVIVGTLVFFYYRLVARLKRMTLSSEGLLILLIIFVMMIADAVYWGADDVRAARSAPQAVSFSWASPAASVVAVVLQGEAAPTLKLLWHAGFWMHTCLVLLFLNLLPISKHFHVITAIPNVFLQHLGPQGRLPKIDDIEGKIEREETLGLARIDQLSWKGVLDLYTCTECGRCTDHCPANQTGKLLSPKHLTLDLRDHLYHHEKKLLAAPNGQAREGEAPAELPSPAEGGRGSRRASVAGPLVPDPIKPEVLWACVTCLACETECPVFISYVDKIVDLRRNLVMERSEFPAELQNAFQGIERNANPWSFPPDQRAAWTEGLDVPRMAEKQQADVLLWVGCSASFDERAKKIARATACLLKAAGVDFAILGEEEMCTGDPARRAGNEFLFQMMAQTNIETLNKYKFNKLLTVCPHCFNTLGSEYPDFGGNYTVVHHSQFLSELVRQGRLKPRNPVNARVVYHDSCYLGRYNDVYDPPRDTLRAIPGLTLLEPAKTRDRGMCCGAGGAQMFKEEEHGHERVNHRRVQQLLDTGPQMVASACPFCQRMLIDALADKQREDVPELDIAELLWKSVEPKA